MPINQTLKICFNLLLTLLILLILASCGDPTDNPTPKPDDKTPPTIVSLIPTDKSSSVSLSSQNKLWIEKSTGLPLRLESEGEIFNTHSKSL
jgi:hypothetical protein